MHSCTVLWRTAYCTYLIRPYLYFTNMAPLQYFICQMMKRNPLFLDGKNVTNTFGKSIRALITGVFTSLDCMSLQYGTCFGFKRHLGLMFLLDLFLDFFFFYVRYKTLLYLPPFGICVGGSWDRTQECCDFGFDSHHTL
jgi:hypothetical protein